MHALIDPNNPRYKLHVESMDRTHAEFIDLVNRLVDCDKAGFSALFAKLVSHTEAHFAAENQLMEESGFPALTIHQGEHARVLGEMQRFAERVSAGSAAMALAYVREQLPTWFELHAMTMDSALAGHIRGCSIMPR